MGERGRGGLKRALIALLCVLVSSISLSADKDFLITVEPVFIGNAPGSDVSLVLTISNAGADAEGEVTVRTEGFRMRYPVQLPRGSKKKLISYLHGLREFNEIYVELDTDEGGVEVRYTDPSFAGVQSRPIVLITDHPGQMNFLRLQNNEEERDTYGRYVSYADSYIKPANAPERALAYNNLPAVVLGDGAERLSNNAVRALRQWVNLGGTVVFIGGASAPILADSRWHGILPVRQGQARTVPSSDLLATHGGSPVTEPMAVLAATPVEGASAQRENGVALIVTKPCGMGRSMYFAFNPFEAPLDHWTGRRKLFTKAIDLSHTMQAAGWIHMQSRTGEYGYEDPYGGMYRDERSEGPFSATLPPTSTVVMLLLLYFVLVVPLNLVILRVKGRGELAWITSPIISLGFAGIFFAFAGSLYSAELSVAPKGMLVLDAGSGDGYFVGETQIFFPRGGSYDLKMDNLEYVTARPVMDDYYMGRSHSPRQDTIGIMNAEDVGNLRIQNMAVSNLSFHQFAFAQSITNQRAVRSNLTFKRVAGGILVNGSITNSSPYTFKSLQLVAARYKNNIGTLLPGETKQVKNLTLKIAPRRDPRGNEYRYYEGFGDAQLADFLGSRNVALFGEIEGYRPGPGVGRLVRQETRIVGVIFLPTMIPEAG